MKLSAKTSFKLCVKKKRSVSNAFKCVCSVLLSRQIQINNIITILAKLKYAKMKNRSLLIISLFITSSFFSQSEKDKKWDIANPEVSFKEVDFTTTKGTWMSLDLSPDGKKISFTSDAGGGDNICTMNTDGADAKQITTETFRLLNNAVWTPNGNYLIARKHFSSTRSLGYEELRIHHVSAGEGVQLTSK